MTAEPDPTPFPLDHLAERGADADVALILKQEKLSFADLRDRVRRLAAWLAHQAPEKGARIATWATKGELTCLMPLAAARAHLLEAFAYSNLSEDLQHLQRPSVSCSAKNGERTLTLQRSDRSSCFLCC